MASSPQAKKGGVSARAIISIVIIAILAILIFQNFATVPINFFAWTLTLPVWLVIVVSFVLGMVLGGAARGLVRSLRGKPKVD